MPPFLSFLLLWTSHAAAPLREHHWPNIRGKVGSYSLSNVKVPRNFSNGRPSWKWTHPNGQYGTVIVGGPVIDYDRNLYFVELLAINKISPDGTLLWSTKPVKQECFFPDGPSLMGDSVYVSTTCGELCSIDIATGKYKWAGRCMRYFPTSGAESKYVTGHDGVVIIFTDSADFVFGGSKHVVGVNGTDGSKLWDFSPDVPTWATMGMFPGDDTVLFQDWDSRAYRLGLHNGSLIWKSGGRSRYRVPFPPYAETWSDGGLLLGADGVAYAVSSAGSHDKSPFAYTGGGVHAHRLSDGKMLWEVSVDHSVFTWPVSAKLEGDTSFTVFAFPSAGAPKNCVPWEVLVLHVKKKILADFYQIPSACVMACLLLAGWAYVRGGKLPPRRRLAGICFVFACIVCAPKAWIAVGHVLWYYDGRETPSDIVALDADTGRVKFKHTLDRVTRQTAKGDQEGFRQRNATPPYRETCCPMAYSSPSVDGNGVVYIGHMSGTIFGVKDWDKNGAISEDEVYKFDAEGAFLHSGPAFAPGMFAIATCEQLFVWTF